MLSKEENERLTRVGPGTPCGELLRRYWHPIYPEILLRENAVRRVRILGEDLTLFRDRKGKLGLIADRCAHRLASLHLGIPDERGLRCCYHGWLFDHAGRCLDQPLEPVSSKLRDQIRIKAYPVQEMGGLIWADRSQHRCCRVGTCSSARTASARFWRTSCPATGCSAWKIVETSGMPSICTAPCSNTCGSARACRTKIRQHAITPRCNGSRRCVRVGPT